MMRALLLGLVATALAAPAAAQARAEVDVMVVGKSRVLKGPTGVALEARTAKVGRRRCAIGAATPLSALAGTGLSFHLVDGGRCSRRARDAGSLYVDRVGRERARGRAGWVYKVGRRAGTTGAADPSGPFGTGRRLRDGQRVLWFWCVLNRADGCQRTLDAVPARTRVARGAPLRVTVRGYDDAGRGVAVSGATVRLGGAAAVTGAGGVAAIRAPRAAGRYRVRAERRGMVVSFPRAVAVR